MPKDTLNSKQVAQIVDLLCEGEIEGFPNAGISHSTNPEQYAIGALKDVFFNNTPVLGAAASISGTTKITDADIQEHLNFDVGRGIFQTELGTQSQGPLTKFPGSTNSSTTQVNTEVPKGDPTGGKNQTIFKSDGTPVVRTITDVDVDQVNITIGVPALTRVKDKFPRIGS